MSTYCKAVNVRTSDIDEYDQIRPYAFLDYFQDIAALHAAYLNVGYEDAKKKNIAWVLTKTKLVIYKNVKAYETIVSTTWPSNQTKYDFSRDYRIFDQNGDIVAEGTSQWILINFATRKIIRTELLNFPEGEELPPIFTNRLEKLPNFDFTNKDVKYSHTIKNSDLDHNGHTNNVRYAVMIYDALQNDPNKKVKELELNYHLEAMLHDTVDLYYEEKDNIVTGCGVLRDQNRVSFSFRLIYDKSTL